MDAPLALDERGRLDDARKAADSALLSDPQFEQASALRRQIDAILTKAKDSNFRRVVTTLAAYEWSLLEWPFESAFLSNCSEFSTAEYEGLWKSGKVRRSLLYWMTRLGRTNRVGAVGNFSEITFGSDEWQVQGVSKFYLEVGGGEPVLFWCDVYASDPDLAQLDRFRKIC